VRWTVAIAVLLALTPRAAAAQQGASVAQQLRENQERLERIRRERAELENQLRTLSTQMRTISAELQNIERQKGVTSRIVNELERQMSSMNSQLDTVTLELLIAQDALAEKRAVLMARLSEIYKRGTLYAFQVLLAAESFGDLLSRYKYLYLVSRQDRSLVDQVESLQRRVAGQRQRLVSIRNVIASQRDERSQELERFAALERRRQQTLRATRASRERAATRLDSLARDEERLASVIAELERERRLAIARGDRSADATITTDDLGNLDWPVEGGRLVYRFGPAPGPDRTQILYNGIGIAVPVGTPVRAVGAGTVELAAPFGTYGPTVVLDHGGGIYTLYLNLSAIDVRPNQWVARGTVIGRSGGGASDHGPHIEFQIRQTGPDGINPIALDPENWLKRRR
jgi:septal ring factor EnvC (AmiA/AmiB activator)